jgi:hypothetical protein
MRELPRADWEAYVRSRDESALLAAVAAQPERPPPDADYPEFHRLRDVDLRGRAYRVYRLIDPDDGQERLFIEPTDVPDFGREGVPHRLQGKALRRWVREEAANPAKNDIDWDAYR